MRMLNMRIFLVLCGLILFVGGCSDSDPVVPELVPSVQVSIPDGPLGVGEPSRLSISLENIDESVFALSMRIGYDSALVEIDDTAGFIVGDFLGMNAIALLRVEGGLIYLSVTDVASVERGLNSNLLGEVVLKGLSAGQCTFTVAVDALRFMDATGAEVEMPDLEVTEVSLVVQ